MTLGRKLAAIAMLALTGCSVWDESRGATGRASVDSRASSDTGIRPVPSDQLSQAPRWDPTTTGAEAPDSGVFSLPGMECLVNKHGIRVKVLVRDDGVRCQERHPDGSLVGPPLKQFRPYFVFDAVPPEGEAQAYRIGSTPRRDSILGWVRAASVARWDTRVGVRYARREDVRVPPLLVYEDPQSLVEILETGSTAAQPLARATLTAERTLMPWPIADFEQVTVNGRVHELVRINFLGELKQGADIASDPVEDIAVPAVYSAAEVQDFRSQVRMLDVVFCVDNTHSTGDFIQAIREAVVTISQRVHDMPMRPDVQFGLVLYRDYVDGVMYDDGAGSSVVRVLDLNSDLEGFLDKVRPLREASNSSVDWEEAGYDGLMASMMRPSWRGDRLSKRVVVLIGDNSFHEPGSSKNPHGIGLMHIAQASKDRRARVLALSIDGKGGEEEQEKHWNQFRSIAQATGGACFRLEDAERVVDRIRSLMEEETDVVATRAVVFDGITDGKGAAQIAADHDIDIRKVTEVMEFLSTSGVDVDKLKPGVPSFATGWALCEVGGTQILDREVYVARAELDVLLAALNLLCSNLSADFGRQAFGLGIGGRVDPLSSFFQGEVPEPLDVFLMAKGIPVGRSSILQLSAAEVRHMPEEARAQLRERIARSKIPALMNCRNDDSLWSFRDDLEFGWIPEAVLP